MSSKCIDYQTLRFWKWGSTNLTLSTCRSSYMKSKRFCSYPWHKLICLNGLIIDKYSLLNKSWFNTSTRSLKARSYITRIKETKPKICIYVSNEDTTLSLRPVWHVQESSSKTALLEHD